MEQRPRAHPDKPPPPLAHEHHGSNAPHWQGSAGCRSGTGGGSSMWTPTEEEKYGVAPFSQSVVYDDLVIEEMES
uniref:Uncharacterized protein n=1 Tax=Sphaerodactylus townsendi TaxID=933632 RepID=A0ACB8EIC8_9SAUR